MMATNWPAALDLLRAALAGDLPAYRAARQRVDVDGLASVALALLQALPDDPTRVLDLFGVMAEVNSAFADMS